MALENPTALFPMFISDRLEATKRFYLDQLGFSAVFDMPGYLQVQYGDDGPQLSFMEPGSWPASEGEASPDLPAFGGEGVVVSVPTVSADDKYSALCSSGTDPLTKPGDKPWGWRSFFVRDPNGVVLDFFHVYKGPPTGANAAG